MTYTIIAIVPDALVEGPTDLPAGDIEAYKTELDKAGEDLGSYAERGMRDLGRPGWRALEVDHVCARATWIGRVLRLVDFAGIENGALLGERIAALPLDDLTLDDMPYLVATLLPIEREWARRFELCPIP